MDEASQNRRFIVEKIIIDIKITVNRVNYVLMGFFLLLIPNL